MEGQTTLFYLWQINLKYLQLISHIISMQGSFKLFSIHEVSSTLIRSTVLTLLLKGAIPNSLCRCLPTHLLVHFHLQFSIKKNIAYIKRYFKQWSNWNNMCHKFKKFYDSSVCQILTEIHPEISVQFLPHSDLSCYICYIGTLCQLWNDTNIYKNTFNCSWSLKPGWKTVHISMEPIQWPNRVQNNSTSHILYKFWQLLTGLGITSTVITAYSSSQTKVKLLTRCSSKIQSWQQCLRESSLNP
jgi:hypothetical protein